jgi:hypothetical protein
MQLFIPSLVALLLGVAIAFFVVPNIAPVMLVGGGAVALLGALYVHWSKFGTMEYERATWQYNLRKYASYIMIAGILLGAYGFYAMNQAGTGSEIVPSAIAANATPALPAVTMPAIGGGMGSVMRTAVSRIGELMRRGRISTD